MVRVAPAGQAGPAARVGSGGSGGDDMVPGNTAANQFAARRLRISPELASAAYQPGPFQGFVNGGQSRAVVGARVYMLRPTPPRTGSPSLSLLTDATGTPADSIGHYVLTDEHGGFSIAGRYTCTPGRQAYLYARGGNSGDDGLNPAIGLMASLGACPQSGTFAANDSLHLRQ